MNIQAEIFWMIKKTKKRPSKYEDKLQVEGSFADLVKVAVSDEVVKLNLIRKKRPSKK